MFWNPGSRSSLYGSPGVFKEQREACAVTPSVHPGGRGCSSGPGAREALRLALTWSLSPQAVGPRAALPDPLHHGGRDHEVLSD